MGFDTGKIILDSPNKTYFPGQTVFGKLQFEQTKPKTFRGMYLKVNGYASTHWTSRHTRRRNGKTHRYTETHEAREDYITIKQYLLGGETGECTIAVGKHEFPFQFLIPPNCPSSFSGTYGKIIYEMKIVVDRPFKIDQHKNAEFRVISPLDLNHDPYCQDPMQFDIEQTFCCWCMTAGLCETIVKLPKSGFCPGQTMPFEVNCENKSNVDINNVKLKLVQNITFIAHSAPAKKLVSETIANEKKGPIPGNNTRNWIVEMKVPAVDVCNVGACNIIKVSYDVEVHVNTSGCHKNQSDSCRLVLGNIPLRGYQDQYTNPLQHEWPSAPVPSLAPPVPYTDFAGYPSGQAPYSDNTPYNPNITPYPASPNQNALAPGGYPNSGSPYPTKDGSPYPNISSPHPNSSPGPQPVTGYPNSAPPYPTFGLPYPNSAPPYPGSAAPYPSGNSPYPAPNPGIGFGQNASPMGMPMPAAPYPTTNISSPYSEPTAPGITESSSQPPYNPEFMNQSK